MNTTPSIKPIQKVSYNIKRTQKWKHENVDYVIATTEAFDSLRRSPVRDKQRNYDLFNNKIDPSAFLHKTNPYGLAKKDGETNYQLPATLQSYDILYPIFSRLISEEGKRFFDPKIKVINEEAISQKEDQRQSAVFQLYQEYLLGYYEEEPAQFTKYVKTYNIKDMREVHSTYLLQYYKRRLNLGELFIAGIKDYLIAGEEFYRVGTKAKRLDCTLVNTMEVKFKLPDNSEFIDYSDQILETNYLTPNEIVDEFYEYLTPTQITELEEMNSSGADAFSNMPYKAPVVESIYHYQNQDSRMGKHPVYRCTWKSFKKIFAFHYIDEQGNEQEEFVSEEFVWDKSNPDQWVEPMWISEYWEGIRIGEDMYLTDLIRPKRQQFRSIDNISECKSGYIGNISSARNSVSTSLMDRCIPWINLYLSVWYDTELALATNVGKIGLIDISLVPEGWDVEKWLYYARAMRIGFVNSLNEGNRKLGINGQNLSTQNKELNLEMGSYIQFNINLLQQIEQKIMFTTGVSPQRMGDVGSYDAVGNTQSSIVNSSMTTEDLFRVHNGIKLRVCEAIIEVAKQLIGNDTKTFQYITDDLSEVLFTVDGKELMNCDMGVFVTDAVKDMEAYQMFKDHVKFALQNDQMAFHQIADIYTSESLTEIRNKLKEHYMLQQEQLQKQQQDAMQIEQMKIQANQEATQDELELRQYISDTGNQTKIAVAQLNTFIGQKTLDLDNNGILDPIEIGNQALKRLEIDSTNMIEKVKVEHEKVKAARDARIKEDEIKSKEKIEKLKAATAIKVAKSNKNKYDSK